MKIDHNHQIQAEWKKRELMDQIEKDNWKLYNKMVKVKPFFSSRSMDMTFKKQQKKMQKQKSRQAKLIFPILAKTLSQRQITTNKNNRGIPI